MHQFFTKTKLLNIFFSSLFLFIFSIVLAFVILPLVIDSQIDKNIRLERGTEQWHRFKHLPFNVSFNITLFAVDNVEDVILKGAKPHIREQGPYVFDQVITKKQINYHDENNSVSYDREIQFYFNQTTSGKSVSINDTITMINPVYIIVMQVLEELSVPGFLVKKCFESVFTDPMYILKDYPVRNLMFDGIKMCDFNLCGLCGFFKLSKIIEEVKEGKQHYLKFSLFNYKRRSSDGRYEINTGVQEIDKIGKIEQWNYSNLTKTWNSDVHNNTCNEVKGTDATIFPPHLDDKNELTIYSTDICRTVTIYRNGSDTYKGIEGYIYKTKPSIFYASTPDATEDCYCSLKKGTRDFLKQPSCFLDGVLDIHHCIGLPVLISQPHFLNADSKYLVNLTGDINPDPAKHEIIALLDKNTGIPLQAHERVQLNIVLRPSPAFSSAHKIAYAVLPLCWIDMGLDLPDSGINLLNSLLYDTINLVNILKWVFIGLSLCLFIGSATLLYSFYFKERNPFRCK